MDAISQYKNSIKLIGNNGSVPENYFQEFELILYENGFSQLTFQKNGKIETENKQLDLNNIATLFKFKVSLKSKHTPELLVGGPQKLIIISINKKQESLIINETEDAALDFFKQCLNFYDTGLIKKLADIL